MKFVRYMELFAHAYLDTHTRIINWSSCDQSDPLKYVLKHTFMSLKNYAEGIAMYTGA